jgi:hypothetical protein
MNEHKYSEHDGHCDQRRSRHDDERHVDDEAQRDGNEQCRRQKSFRAQEGDDRVGQRHGAESEFLALVDVVLDRNAVRGNAILIFEWCGPEREPWIERDNPGHRQQQHKDIRKAINTGTPRVERSK